MRKVTKLKDTLTSDMHIISNQIFNLINTPIEQNFERLARMTKRMFDVPITVINLFDEKRQIENPIVTIESDQKNPHLSLLNELNLDEILVVEDATQNEQFRDHKLVTEDPGIRFFVSCPIFEKNGRKVGSLMMLDYKPRSFPLNDLEMLNDIIKLIEKEICDFRLSRAQKLFLQEIATKERTQFIDAKTRAWNYDVFKKIGQYQINDSHNEKSHFALAVIDIDNLNEINQQYGKDIGDEVLTLASRTISRSCRDADTIARGDDEDFMLIINANDLKFVTSVVNRIQANIAKEEIKLANKIVRFNVTIGVTYFNQEITDLETMIQSAKIALLKGKRLGRNRIEFN